jgi:uncharacterized membrane protein
MRLRVVAVPVGAIISLIGLVWLLQGIDFLSGSLMSGSQFWAVASAFAVIVGLLLIGAGLIQGKGNR